MTASYPGSIKYFSAVVNGVTKLVAALFNAPYDEITALQTELGTDVAGLSTDLKTRLAGYDSGWFDITTSTSYVKTHNLGTTKVLITAYIASATGGGGTVSRAEDSASSDSSHGIFMVALSTTQITYRTSGAACWLGVDNAGTQLLITTAGSMRIIILPLA